MSRQENCQNVATSPDDAALGNRIDSSTTRRNGRFTAPVAPRWKNLLERPRRLSLELDGSSAPRARGTIPPLPRLPVRGGLPERGASPPGGRTKFACFFMGGILRRGAHEWAWPGRGGQTAEWAEPKR